MDEYIEREALWKLFKREYELAKPNYKRGWQGALQLLYDAPAADVAPVVHGHWILTDKWASKAQYKCSVCSRRMMGSLDANKVIGKYPYCHCGAKMQEVR